MARTKFSELRNHVVARPGAGGRLAALRVDTIEELRRYDSATAKRSARPNRRR